VPTPQDAGALYLALLEILVGWRIETPSCPCKDVLAMADPGDRRKLALHMAIGRKTPLHHIPGNWHLD
jgi:hypothetical protein